MTATVLRKELHEVIDTLPEQTLSEIKSYITSLLDNNGSELIIEEASPEEAAMIEEDLKEYYENPESFRLWSEIRKECPDI